jgi:hypothetical protein
MSFQGMGKSINPMCDFLKPKPQGETMTGSALRLIVLMSLQPAIPWRVALLHCPPPLHRLDTILHRPVDFVNHHLAGAGEFSTGTMGNFQPDLTDCGKTPKLPRQQRSKYAVIRRVGDNIVKSAGVPASC